MFTPNSYYSPRAYYYMWFKNSIYITSAVSSTSKIHLYLQYQWANAYLIIWLCNDTVSHTLIIYHTLWIHSDKYENIDKTNLVYQNFQR